MARSPDHVTRLTEGLPACTLVSAGVGDLTRIIHETKPFWTKAAATHGFLRGPILRGALGKIAATPFHQ